MPYMTPRFSRAGRRGKYSYKEFNRLLEEVERQSKLTVYGADLEDSKTGRVLAIREVPNIVRTVVTTIPDQDVNPDIYLVKKRWHDDGTAGSEFPIYSEVSREVDEEIDVYKPNGGTNKFFTGTDTVQSEVRWRAFPEGGGGKGARQFKVTTGGLTSVEAKEWDGTTLGTGVFVITTIMGHAVDDIIYAVSIDNVIPDPDFPEDTMWLEVLKIDPSTAKYKVVQVVDTVGRLGLDWVRAHS